MWISANLPLNSEKSSESRQRSIATDFSGGIVRDNPAVNKLVADMTALGRVGVPDDIGPVIASLLSDDNHWVTGQRIEASGGMVL
jgi:NAD(P)-dependent dehydrogenase (short-subunit alcohol dehydrogenase family)